MVYMKLVIMPPKQKCHLAKRPPMLKGHGKMVLIVREYEKYPVVA